MSTLLADSSHHATEAAPSVPPQAPGEGAPPAASAPPTAQPPGAALCASCGAALAPGQDWCLQCGTASPGSAGRPGWRGIAAVALATVVLVLAAAAAGLAALSRHKPRAPVRTTTVAQVTPPAAAPPAVTAPPQTFSTPTPAPAPPAVAKPPTIPLNAATPPVTTPPTNATSTPSKEQPSSTGTGTGAGSAEKQPEALLLDTNAASTYNPYGYPAAWFGDPSLAIDGDSSTGWTAQVNPATAPHLAEGLLIDLKSAHKLGAVKLITATPGIVVQLYGSAASAPPASITDPSWVPLSHSVTLHKRHARLGLLKPKRAFRFVALWISAAPASAVGTAAAPGHIAIDELELFPPA
ncbi:MAG: hypothetical protein ACYDC2_10275 [Solirubrobacteraceae bacterium]